MMGNRQILSDPYYVMIQQLRRLYHTILRTGRNPQVLGNLWGHEANQDPVRLAKEAVKGVPVFPCLAPPSNIQHSISQERICNVT
ncbi:hypothetical protein Pst134EA_028234 [Puccinia striiformis f. sp. tritici]|uniref:hypothetical protein n=1 Tax=Puccinia striiformis f. sp. tritici TaxID=168172 RepID=UPI0020083981|nr:hypothetical protein Pst134EA_028234 [Puccinia striiformis f. sp. tritici]KAH9442533.1 hypothetical protein Pst134EB_028785 [Puccinia striiformis f. sp. tritici]KAH9448945.1 hypothetical protein Pst134EA_028234 [Puccinia striiformis f. sp. tritici]KAI9617930.1 hypothetical protein H4Q26_012797 [Puccinia striiformis f. sp. tritici PST-130]KAI9627892.1 hypothetical protein KEM48_011969 [Puccinia striiformis f. sp. tritici PST-130]